MTPFSHPIAELVWPPPAQPALGENEVDLCWIDPQIEAGLKRRERNQAVLQGVLRAYLPPATALRFAREDHGRPYLDLPGAPDFNFSDTRGGSVMVIAARGRVGIDLERSDRALSAQALATRWFSAEEARALAALPSEAAAAARFIRLWTAKEASCKATGTGIFGWLDRWQFDPDSETPHLQALPDEAGPASDWRYLRLSPSPGFTCVVALQGLRPRWRRFYRLQVASSG